MLANPFVRTIIISRVFLQLGIWIRNFAILLYVTDATNNDPHYVSLISVAEYAPIFLFAIIGGTFADRWLPKRTMIWCDVLSALSILAVLFIVVYGSWQALLFATLVSAVLSQFSQPSAMKLFKHHVEAGQMQRVMAMFQSLMAIFLVIGPAIGTFVYQSYGIEASLAATVVLFIVSAAMLSFLPRDHTSSGAVSSGSFMQELKEGLRYVWSSLVLRTLFGSFFVSGLAVGLVQPLMLYVAIENLGQGKDFLQWLLMANGAAMLVGGGAVMGAAKKVRPQTLLAMGLVISAAGMIGVGFSHSIPLTLVLQAMNGLCFPCIQIGMNTLMMKNTEGAFIGRVGGVLTPMFMGMMVVGMSLASVVMNAMGLLAAYFISGVLLTAGAVILLPLFRNSGDHNKKTDGSPAGIEI